MISEKRDNLLLLSHNLMKREAINKKISGCDQLLMEKVKHGGMSLGEISSRRPSYNYLVANY